MRSESAPEGLSGVYSKLRGLKLIAFDLDGTIWTPGKLRNSKYHRLTDEEISLLSDLTHLIDMYQLWGGGSPFTYASNKKDLMDKSGHVVRLLGISGEILDDVKSHPSLQPIKVVWVSCTDEPVWAKECLEKFRTVPSGNPIGSAADGYEIFSANKQVHFKNLRTKYPSIDFSEMLFFDNEYGNIRSVSQLGVRCVHCPDGMTSPAWLEGLSFFVDDL